MAKAVKGLTVKVSDAGSTTELILQQKTLLAEQAALKTALDGVESRMEATLRGLVESLKQTMQDRLEASANRILATVRDDSTMSAEEAALAIEFANNAEVLTGEGEEGPAPEPEPEEMQVEATAQAD